MTTRGSYRAIHTVIVDGPDYQALSPDAKLVLLTLKLNLGATGIDVLYAAVLQEQTALTAQRVEAALAALEKAKWVRRERNVMWVVEGLRYEPSRSLTNANHRAEIDKHADSLPRLAIVDAFRAHYGLARKGIQTPAADPADGMGDGIPDGMGDGMGKHGEREERKNGDGGTESLDAPGASEGSAATAVDDDPPGFAACWAAYPDRPNNPRKKAVKAYLARVRAGVEPAVLLAGTERYARFCVAAGKAGSQFVMHAATFYGPDEHYTLSWDVPVDAGAVRPSAATASPARVLLDALEGAGLTHDGLGNGPYGERMDALAATLGRDPAEFRALAKQIRPWTLGKITFPPERLAEMERRLRAAGEIAPATGTPQAVAA